MCLPLANIIESSVSLSTKMMSLKRLKTANKQFKYSVFGYLRDHEKKQSINIPEMIKYICLNYYLLTEKFTKHGDAMSLNESKDTVQKNDNIDVVNSVYGDVPIDIKDESIIEYEWKFKIEGDLSLWFGIGIDSSNKEWINADFAAKYSNKSQFYAWEIIGSAGKAYMFPKPEVIPDPKTLKLERGYDHNESDQTVNMTLTLNTQNQSLRLEFDDKEIKCHENITWQSHWIMNIKQ